MKKDWCCQFLKIIAGVIEFDETDAVCFQG
jgi:hypothetical protein